MGKKRAVVVVALGLVVVLLTAIPAFGHDTGRWCSEKKAELQSKFDKKMSVATTDEEKELYQSRFSSKKSELAEMCVKKKAMATKAKKSKSKSKTKSNS